MDVWGSNNFKFTDFKKNLKIDLSCVGKFYRVSAILINAYTCLYKNNVSQYFAIDPPLLEEYFNEQNYALNVFLY